MYRQENPYAPLILELMPKVLSSLDRDSDSPTFGSFDRHYWHLKIHNFSSAVVQQGALLLLACYQNDFEGNEYFHNVLIREWIEGALAYWARIQNHDGSYDEYWKGEGSFPATAFSTFAATEIALALGTKDARIYSALKRSINFLARRTETFAANQEIASTAAVYNMFLLTKEKMYRTISESKIRNLQHLQTSDGFFPEHGGADMGYSFVALEYLAILYERTGKDDIRDMCNKLILFLSFFTHPDGTIGGSYASRGTTYFMPGGLESCSGFNLLCPSMLDRLNNARGKTFIPPGIDERYLLHFFSLSLTRALTQYIPKKKTELLPYEQSASKLFPKANLYILNKKPVHLTISLFKGGAYKLYIDGHFMLEDTGYRIRKGNRVFLTEIGEGYRFSLLGNEVYVEKYFHEKGFVAITPFRSLILVVYSYLFGNRLWGFFRKKFILNCRKTKTQLKRRFFLEGDKIIVADEIINAPRGRLLRNPHESIKSIPSGKFFQTQQLYNQLPSSTQAISGHASITTEIDLRNKSIKTNFASS
jgi:hypothetical protein